MSTSVDGYMTHHVRARAEHRPLIALDRLDLVLPLVFGGGMQLTPALVADAGLTYESTRALPGGAVEIVYAVT